MVREIRIHDYDEVSSAKFQAMYVRSAESKFAGAWLEHDMWAVGFGQLVGDDLCAVRRAVVDDDEFPVQLSERECEF